MDTRQTRRGGARRAFTLVELLVVIAIISILAAILLPVFNIAREQARQSSAMSNMHEIYVGVKLFNEDEGYYPTVLFGYAEAPLSPAPAPPLPAQEPAMPADVSANNITLMAKVKEYFVTNFNTNYQNYNRGYLFPEQVKDSVSFTDPDNPVKNQQTVTEAYYPANSLFNAGQIVTWQGPGTGACPATGDRDLPNTNYIGTPKYYYTMDSMDIGPVIGPDGRTVPDPNNPGNPKYELHYSPDWSHQLGQACEPADPANGGKIDVTQLKYKNPPADATIITYITEHVVTAGSSKVLILLLNGTARKISVGQAATELPLNYH